jgi:hypothetical protein
VDKATLAVKELKNGGVFINAEGGIVFAYVKDEDGGRKVLETVKGKAKIILLKGEYTSEQLKSLEKTLVKEIAKSGLLNPLWSGISPGYTWNKVILRFGRVNINILKAVEEIVKKLDMPLNAVVVKEQLKPIPISRESYIRPLMGGIKIRDEDHGKCTLGFIAERNGVRGFVTAGHCVSKGSSVYQPTDLSGCSSCRVGTVVVKSDPNTTRDSDSAWDQN